MVEAYKKWYSPHLSGDFELLTFGESGYPLVLFPTSMGRHFEAKDFKLVESAQSFIENGTVKIYCVDSIDGLSWYNQQIHPADRIRNHIWYDQLLLKEVTPIAQQETGFEKIIVAGCSFGGYHAANFAFRHPWLVSHLFSMSGLFDIRQQLDGFYNDDAYFNNPVDFLPHDQNRELWAMKIALGTTDRDPCRADNEKLSKILSEKGIDHWFDLRENADHDWPVWREMFPAYISQL